MIATHLEYGDCLITVRATSGGKYKFTVRDNFGRGRILVMQGGYDTHIAAEDAGMDYVELRAYVAALVAV